MSGITEKPHEAIGRYQQNDNKSEVWTDFTIIRDNRGPAEDVTDMDTRRKRSRRLIVWFFKGGKQTLQ